MKQSKLHIVGWILFVLAAGLFCIQMGYFFVHERYQAEYVDNRIFYIINILCAISLAGALVLIVRLGKKWIWLVSSLVVLFSVGNGFLLVQSNQEIRNITSVSPNFKHVLSLKENTATGKLVYYRDHYRILARPRESLPFNMDDGAYKVEWLANDVAAVTFRTTDDTIQQFIGTYGDRGSGTVYYYVGSEIHGTWENDAHGVTVVSDTEGISVNVDGASELFEWDDVVQHGTLAVVLKRGDEAAWTISLNENFKIYSDETGMPSGEITLYEATMDENEPVVLEKVDEDGGSEF